jgi:hypothetical protein
MSTKFILVPESEYQNLVKNIKAAKHSDNIEEGEVLEGCISPPAPEDLTQTIAPVPTPTTPLVKSTSTDEDDSVLELLPKNLRTLGQRVLGALKRRLSWDPDTGLVSIEDTPIKGLFILDLLYTLCGIRIKDLQTPGLDQIVTLLRDTNFPRVLVRNRKIRNLLTEPEAPTDIATDKTNESTLAPPLAKRPWIPWK